MDDFKPFCCSRGCRMHYMKCDAVCKLLVFKELIFLEIRYKCSIRKFQKKITLMWSILSCGTYQETNLCLLTTRGQKEGFHTVRLGCSHCVHPSFLLGGVNLQPNFQKGGGGLTGPQLLERGCWERGGWLFSKGGGELQFSPKKKKIIKV